jgi:TolA-binding protein
MGETNAYLTDEFVAFSGKISALQHQKKQKQMEIKKALEAAQHEIGELDKQAKAMTSEWEAFANKFGK